MIFQHTWEQVLDGTKTQTRRLVKPGEHVINVYGMYVEDINETSRRVGDLWDLNNPHRIYDYGPAITNGQRRKWQIGQSYAVQPGRGKKAIGRIRITGIRQERLQDITSEDAIAEGMPFTLAKTEGYVYDPADLYADLWTEIHDIPGTRWDDNPLVWVLEFELVR